MRLARLVEGLRKLVTAGPDDLLRDPTYRRLWSSVLASAFGMQIMLLALPLTAAVSLRASPTDMGLLTAMETLPFTLFSLPSGVWLDRMRKLPVYVAGELALAAAAVSVPVAHWLGFLSVPWLLLVAFVVGLVNTTAGSASQIVLNQIVGRDRLIEAYAKNALANSGAEVAGPAVAGLLIRFLGAPVALLVNAVLLLTSASILGGISIDETPARGAGGFWLELLAGVRFVRRNRLLVVLAGFIAAWEFFNGSAVGVNILFATRNLGMSGAAVGLSYVCLGVGTVLGSLSGGRLSRRAGPGRCIILGFALTASGSSLLAASPTGGFGRAAFALDLMLLGFGAILIFVNFIALRQAATPTAMLGRMTSTMRWLILIPAAPGALIGGWLGQHADLRAALGFAALGGWLLTILALRSAVLRGITALPDPDDLGPDLEPEVPAR